MVKHLLLTLYSQLHFSSFPLGKFSMKWQVLQWNMKVAKPGSLLGVPLEAFTEDASHCHTSCTASKWQNMFISHRFIARLYLLQYLELLQLFCQVLAGFEIIHLPFQYRTKLVTPPIYFLSRAVASTWSWCIMEYLSSSVLEFTQQKWVHYHWILFLFNKKKNRLLECYF